MKYVLFLFLTFFAFSVKADDIPTDALVLHFFTNVQKMTLHFDQTKTIPDIENSFYSSGIFQFEKNKGVIIKQDKPNKQVFVSTLEKYCFADKVDSLKNLPNFSDIKSLIDHLLSGNFSDLNRIFDINYIQNKTSWKMELLPVHKDIKKMVTKIILTGDKKQIKQFVIEYTDGSKINIDYSPTDLDLTDEIKC